MLLSNGEISAIAKQVNTPVDNPDVAFARAIIAAHEAKRAMPEEWIDRAMKIVDGIKRPLPDKWDEEACEQFGQEDYYDSACRIQLKALNALRAHISTPPAGMVLVPEEPTAAMQDAALRLSRATIDGFELLPRTKELWASAQIYAAMIAAAKEPK